MAMYDESILSRIPKEELLPNDDPNLPPVDGRVDITFDKEGTIANMTLYAPRNGGRPITAEAVFDELKKNGIVAGIDEFDVKDMVKQQVYETPICVARMVEPKRGKNGYVSFRFEREVKLKPHKDEFGIANFRELNSITPIRKGDVIADIALPTPGTPGTNIFGKPIPAEAGVAAKVTVGKNTHLTADGKQIVSACDGHIYYGKGCFVVEDTVTIKTDLDLSIGNINFFGDIHIKGNVMEGFSVTAGKNTRIDGTVFGSEITAGGNVTIVGGCIGAKVECGGNADIGFCENTQMKIKGNIVSKQYAFCDVFCYGAVSTKGPNGVIVGGKITSMHDVTASVIGSEKYTQTEINIGDGSVLFARKREAEADLEDTKSKLSNAVMNLQYLKNCKKSQAGLLTEAQSKQEKIEVRNKLTYSMRKNELTKLIAQLDDDIKNKDNLCAKCTRVIYPGSRFCVNFLTLEVSEITKKSIVTIVDDKLTTVEF